MTRLASCLFLVLLAAPLAAHDFWIEPSSWTPRAGELVSVKLRVGSSFIGDPVPRDAALIERFALVDAKGAQPIAGISGNDPAGLMRATAAPCSMIVYESRPSSATLTPEKVAQYVREESLERQIRILPSAPIVDHFSRSAIALLRSGTECTTMPPSGGLTLQIVVGKDPATTTLLPVTLLFRDKPIAGITLIAFPRKSPRSEQRVTTDAAGRAQLRLDTPGPWLIKAVRIEQQKDGSYRSYWASMTFTR